MATASTETKAAKTTAKQSVFEVLSRIDCSAHIEHKSNGKTELSYLSWAWAWHIAKQNFPAAFYTIYERDGQIPYFTDGRTCWVKTGVTIEGLEHIEYLPVMDYRNVSIPLDKVTSMDINKAIQRSLTKAIARHGLGLYVYAGEDLPDAADDEKRAATNAGVKPPYKPMATDTYWKIVKAYGDGRKTKVGGDYRQAWIDATNAGPAEVRQFDEDVEYYRLAANGGE